MQYVFLKKNSVRRKSLDRYYLVYYLFMFGVLFFVTMPNAHYASVIRYAYYGAIILPLIFNARFVPFVITSFYGTSINACYSFLPESFSVCLLTVLLLFFLCLKDLQLKYGGLIAMLLFFSYTVLLCFLFGDSEQKFILVGLVAILLFAFIKNEKDIQLLAFAFCLVSLALAVMYFINFRYYMVFTGLQDEFATGSWQNINNLAGSIACGLPLSLAFLINVLKCEKSWFCKSFFIVNSLLILFTLIVISSRGALFSATFASIVLILFSKTPRRYKILLLVLFVSLAIYVFFQGYMDYLIYKLSAKENTESLGGRTRVWNEKMSDFNGRDAITMLFGMGRTGCSRLGLSYSFSTHNDFLTAFLGFGFFGVVLFLITLITPLSMVRKSDLILVFVLTMFLAFECFVLEPIFRGYFLFWVFYILIVRLAFVKRKKHSLVRRKKYFL